MSAQALTTSGGVEPLEPRRLFDGGSFDPSFGGGAVVTTGYAQGSSVLNDLIVYPDGSILAGGYCVPQDGNHPADMPQMALSKYFFDGTLDPSFGAAGQIFATPRGLKNALDLAMLDDGSFLVLGSSVSGYSTRGNLLLKFTPDGRVDTTFGKNGKVSLAVSAATVHVGPADAIFVAGQLDRDGAIARYSPRGGLELDFGDNGLYTTTNLFTLEDDTSFFFDSVALDTDGRIFAGGTHRDSAGGSITEFDVRVVRLHSDGVLDTAFAGRGFFSAAMDFTVSLPEEGLAFGSVSVGSDNLPLVAASVSSGEQAYVTKLNSDGTINPAFSDDGVAQFSAEPSRYPLTGSVVEQFDGKIVFAGIIERSGRTVFSVERLDATGDSDPTYGVDGVATVTYKRIPGEARVAALAPDGSIVVGGIVGSVEAGGINDSRRFTLARLLREEGPAGQLIPKTLRQSQAGFVFDIIWRDDDALDPTTLDGGDLRLYGSDDVARRAKLSSLITSPDGKVITARYRMPAPDNGVFTSSSNGWFAVKLLSNQVSDTFGVFAQRRTLGSIRIRILD